MGAWVSKTDLSDLLNADTKSSVVTSVIFRDLSSLITTSEKSSGLMDLYFLMACFLERETLLLDVISNKSQMVI